MFPYVSVIWRLRIDESLYPTVSPRGYSRGGHIIINILFSFFFLFLLFFNLDVRSYLTKLV